MPRTLIVPGVSVATEFDVVPPPPARSGILGAVGVVDDSSPGVTGVTARQELLQLYGPATTFSFPEALSALANGVSEVVVSPVEGGRRADATLRDDDNEPVVLLMARAAGPWGNGVRVKVSRRLGPDGVTVRNVTIEVFVAGEKEETHEGLILSAGHDQDLFTVINRDSRILVAIDPVFGLELPELNVNRVRFQDLGAAAATRALRRGNADHILLTAASPGAAGNNISVTVQRGRGTAVLASSGPEPSMRLRTIDPHLAGMPRLAARVTANATAGVDIELLEGGAPIFSRTGLESAAAVAQAFGDSQRVLVDEVGDLLPEPGSVPLANTNTVTVRVEGVSTTDYEDLLTADAIVDALAEDPNVDAALAPGADGNQLPGATTPTENAYLTGGRDAGLARSYAGQISPDSVLDLVPAPGTDGSVARFRIVAGAAPATVRIEAGVDLGSGFELREVFDELVMDPDSPRYLPNVLAEDSSLLRAVDRYPRTGTSTFPSETGGTVALANGTAPTEDAYSAAIDALSLQDSVDMLLAGIQSWADPELDGREVHQTMLGHAISEADDAKPRIVIGSVPPNIETSVRDIEDYAGQVRNRRFVLVAPSGLEGAVAGLLGHLDFFQSPTFKTVANPGRDLVPYRLGELNQLLGPNANVCVVAFRRGRGVIVVRGISTDGSQISVTRVADRCVREVKAISDRFIGELNNGDTRNALQQMIHARFAQMERDGALVPSVDGSSPAFQVEVYASQVDSASGIVRIDIAVRPVRAIDYVYATIRVRI